MQKRVQTIIIVITVLAIVGIAARFILFEKRIPEGLIVANGRIEGRITTLFPKAPAWVGKVIADEGFLSIAATYWLYCMIIRLNNNLKKPSKR